MTGKILTMPKKKPDVQPDVPTPPDREPHVPIDEPPGRPHTSPEAPVDEPTPTGPVRQRGSAR
jgi:hypothetical protein